MTNLKNLCQRWRQCMVSTKIFVLWRQQWQWRWQQEGGVFLTLPLWEWWEGEWAMVVGMNLTDFLRRIVSFVFLSHGNIAKMHMKFGSKSSRCINKHLSEYREILMDLRWYCKFSGLDFHTYTRTKWKPTKILQKSTSMTTLLNFTDFVIWSY